jgi:hypothetical protein
LCQVGGGDYYFHGCVGRMRLEYNPDPEEEAGDGDLPVEVELYIQPDGTVIFADLAADTIPIAQQLNPDQPLACDVPPNTQPPENNTKRTEDADD